MAGPPGASEDAASKVWERDLIGFLGSRVVTPSGQTPVHPDREGLVLSYQMDPDDPVYAYLGMRSTSYDCALAAIAFVMAGRYDLAADVLDALERSLPGAGPDDQSFKDGDVWFFLNTHNAYPNPQDHHGAMVRTGANCWVGYAATFYIRAARLDRRADVLSGGRHARMIALAERVAQPVLQRQVIDPADERDGLVSGGWGTVTYECGEEEPRELWLPGEVQWCSTEHNIDAYFFLRDLGELTGSQKYTDAAKRIRRALDETYNPEQGQLNRGVNEHGRDPLMVLDAASWGALYFAANGDTDRAGQSLAATRRYHCVTDSLTGFRPERGSMVYENPWLQAHFYPDLEGGEWDSTPFVWSEGSLGVALALARLGDAQSAHGVLEHMMSPEMNREGGVRYADRVIEMQFCDAPSVAGSAWAYIVLKELAGSPVAQLFWDGE